MKIIKNLLLQLIFILFFNISFSQQKTPYQNKVDQYHSEYFRALNIKESLIIIAQKSNDWSIVTKSQEFSYAVHSLNKNELLTMTLTLDNKIKSVAKLKNSTDFKNDIIKKEKEENELKLIELKKKKEQEEIFQIEENLLKKIKFEKSDFNNLNLNIKSGFVKWLEKNEFEKNETYKSRVNLKSQISFDSICFKNITEFITERKENENPLLHIEKYNSEKEYFDLNIEFNNEIISDTINVNINIAKDFKVEAKLEKNITEDIENWCILENNLFPKKFTIVQNEKVIKVVKTNSNKKKEIIFSTKEFEIENENFPQNNIIFSLNNYKNHLKRLEIEDIKTDSINNIVVYNLNELDIPPKTPGTYNSYINNPLGVIKLFAF